MPKPGCRDCKSAQRMVAIPSIEEVLRIKIKALESALSSCRGEVAESNEMLARMTAASTRNRQERESAEQALKASQERVDSAEKLNGRLGRMIRGIASKMLNEVGDETPAIKDLFEAAALAALSVSPEAAPKTKED